MTKNKILFWIFAILASVAIVLGFCLLFLGTKKISEIPAGIEINNVEGDYYISTQYNAEYSYQFKLEHKLNEDFVHIKTVDSASNQIKLSDFEIDVLAGETYRFSARYTTENGAGNAEFCEAYLWEPYVQLDSVKGINFNEETGILSWEATYQADRYLVLIEDINGQTEKYYTNTNNVNLKALYVGYYKVYLSAFSDNKYLTASTPTEAVEVEVFRKNQILSAVYDNDITVVCTDYVDAFCITLNGEELAIVKPQDIVNWQNKYVYLLEDAKIYMQEGAQIKSIENGYILESESVLII